MVESFEAPKLEDLVGLPLTVSFLEEPWIVAVDARARDGDEVRFVWDEVAASIHIVWKGGGLEQLTLERESVFRVEIEGLHNRVEFRARLRSNGLEGSISVEIGEGVLIRDALLRF